MSKPVSVTVNDFEVNQRFFISPIDKTGPK